MRTSPAAAAGTIVTGALAAVWWLVHLVQAAGPAMPAHPTAPLESFTYSAPAATPAELPTPDAGAVYETSEVTRPALPLEPDPLAAVAALLSSRSMAANSSPAITFAHFIVGRDGLVEPGSVAFGVPRAGLEGVAKAARIIGRIPFRPAEIGGMPVRSRVEAPFIWEGGRARLLVESASWSDDDFIRANPGLTARPRGERIPELEDVSRVSTADAAEAYGRALRRFYPPELAGAEDGLVTLRFLVTGDGRVAPGSVHARTAADPRFAAAAARALDSLRIPPPGSSASAGRAWMTLPVDFSRLRPAGAVVADSAGEIVLP
jgi:hypothetical protein